MLTQTVVGFVCHIGERVLLGVVKKRQQAKADYQKAFDSGQLAGLLEQSSDAADIFRTKIGNVPADGKVVVEITYVCELKQDAQSNGVRFTIPNVIAPRYGIVRGDLGASSDTWKSLIQRGGIDIMPDVQVGKGSVIRGLQSPSHPLAISLGRTSSMPESAFEPHQVSATLSLPRGHVLLGKDFVMIVNAEGQDIPVAFPEGHSTIPNQRALMTSFVPKFNIPNSYPEIVFIIDRSGSMCGNIPTLQSALRVFLKSLPRYDGTILKEALAYVDLIDANMGGYGTGSASPYRWRDLGPGCFLSMVNKAARENPIRFFGLGIGDAASQSLVEGLARAGNGFAQSVLEDEKLDKKVVRMLKGALTPHIQDCSLEIEYAHEEEDDFEMIDKANDIRTVSPPATKIVTEETGKEEKSEKPISLFDPSYKEPQLETKISLPSTSDRFSGLPPVNPPKLLQAPSKITSLYPLIRSNTYVLFDSETSGRTPQTLVFRATSKQGPLELKIPIQDVGVSQDRFCFRFHLRAVVDGDEKGESTTGDVLVFGDQRRQRRRILQEGDDGFLHVVRVDGVIGKRRTPWRGGS
ncbi:hypothetical protein VTN00DRAFT_8222 [Thermoascus crustaceus]|uniref:uncharacterized protein n=1 Tax=Thermoascus crustaceus TaxID=5088 RepID=UPI003744A7E7